MVPDRVGYYVAGVGLALSIGIVLAVVVLDVDAVLPVRVGSYQ